MTKRIAALALLLATLMIGVPNHATAAEDCARFAETGQSVCGIFLAYWQSHGGLAQQGFPLSGAFNERSTIDNRYYVVQYFERAVLELHPNEPGVSSELLSQLGREALQARYPQGAPTAATAPGAASPLPGADTCDELAITGQRSCGIFRTYWQEHGGLPQQGYPLTTDFAEKSAVNGQTYQVQYFERAVFEYHPELPIGQQVLLSQLGRLRLAARYPNGSPVIESPYLVGDQITFKANGSFLEWSIPVTNVSPNVLIAVTITVVFYDATGQVIDSSLAAAVNIEPGETRTLKGLSIKGLNFARYRILPPDVTVRSGA